MRSRIPSLVAGALGAVALLLAVHAPLRQAFADAATGLYSSVYRNASNLWVQRVSTASGDDVDVDVVKIGGAAVTTGAGAVAAGTQRTTLASDDPAVTSLAILDDWDEGDRAKVNLIAGQAGIAAGTGADGATVPRFTLATDVGLPAGSANIGDVDVATFPDNEPFNQAQVSGTATSVDQGLPDGGTQRVIQPQPNNGDHSVGVQTADQTVGPENPDIAANASRASAWVQMAGTGDCLLTVGESTNGGARGVRLAGNLGGDDGRGQTWPTENVGGIYLWDIGGVGACQFRYQQETW